MFSIVYVSTANQLLDSAQLQELQRVSRRNNTAIGVTGMLLYKGGNFMQVIEGEERIVQDLLTKITRDSRHHAVSVLLRQTLSAREFGEWSMGFRDLSSPEVLAMPGYSEFLNVPLTDEQFFEDPTRTQRLLMTFRRTM